jgi:hypothetical protein
MLSHFENYHPTHSAQNLTPALATVLYEDLEAGFNLGLWRFDWLAEHSLGNVALGRANRSALVVISVSSANPLPVAVEKWINAWVATGQMHPLALVVLLPREKKRAREAHQLHERLQAVAQQKRVDFFSEFFENASVSGNPGARAVEPGEETDPNPAQLTPWENESSSRVSSIALSLAAAETESGPMSARASRSDRAIELPDVLTGVTLTDVDAEGFSQINLPSDFRGVLVTCIDLSCAAFQAGLRAGDLIQQMNQQGVTRVAEALAVSKKNPRALQLRVWSCGRERDLTVNAAANDLSGTTTTGRNQKMLCLF